jgi:molybdenum cofactor cytidylyltransferase
MSKLDAKIAVITGGGAGIGLPRIAPSLIDRLIDAFDAAPVEPLAMVPVRGGRRGNPALIGRSLFAAVRMLEGDKGARDLIAAAGKIFSN